MTIYYKTYLQYPLDTNCTYIIKAKPDEQIQVYFEQFALYVDEHSSVETRLCFFFFDSDFQIS